MKKCLFLLLMSLAATVMLHAQVVRQGNKFFDGQYLYVAEMQQDGMLLLKGMDITGRQKDVAIRKNGTKPGEYTLAQTLHAEEAPFGCLMGSRVQYIRENGMNFLAFYPEEHSFGYIMVLTPDNIINCTQQEKWAEENANPEESVSDMLMNRKYLCLQPSAVLERMIAKLKKKQRPTVIERANQQMISYVLAMGLAADHVQQESVEGAPLNAAAPQEKVYTVGSESEFLAALGSNHVINIKDGTVLNLTNILDVMDYWVVFNQLWRDDYYSERTGNKEYFVSCSRFDGRQLDLVNIHNLTIRGGKDCHIIVEPRYANVLNFYKCSNIRLENLTIGHTEEGYCEGGVLYAENCEGISVVGCDLYGCGTYGLQAYNTQGIVMERTVIRDCSYGIMELHGCQYSSFLDCDFLRCREFTLVTVDSSCKGTRFVNCRFAQNQGVLFGLGSPTTFDNCEIHHPADQELGNTEGDEFRYGSHGSRWYRDNEPLP